MLARPTTLPYVVKVGGHLTLVMRTPYAGPVPSLNVKGVGFLTTSCDLAAPVNLFNAFALFVARFTFVLEFYEYCFARLACLAVFESFFNYSHTYS